MRYTYEITPRPESHGGGWRLRLHADGEEVGGDVFHAREAAADVVAAWWATLTDDERLAWLDRSAGGTPGQAYRAFVRAAAYDAAERAARRWLERVAP